MKAARFTAVAVAILLSGTAVAAAQNVAPAPLRGTVYIPGLLPGPDRLGPFQRLCNLRVVGLVEWRVNSIASATKPDAAQTAALANLQAASAEAKRLVSGACLRVRPDTSVGELDVMGQRLAAVTQAFKTVRTAYEAFYAALDAGQRARIDALGPQRHGWRW